MVGVGGSDAVEEDDRDEDGHNGRDVARDNGRDLFEDVKHEAPNGGGAEGLAEAKPDEREQSGVDESGAVDKDRQCSCDDGDYEACPGRGVADREGGDVIGEIGAE